MRDVAVVGFAQRQMAEFDGSPTCVELLVPLFGELYEQTGWTRHDVGFWCSGSSDYLAGRSFSFVQAVDAIGVIPPVNESHVEMDLAWAMYEAWIKIQTGEVDTALVYAFGKSSAGVLRRTLSLQLDPYTMTPIWPDTVSLAGHPGPRRPRRRPVGRAGDGRGGQPLPHRRGEERVRDPQGRLVGRGAAGAADVRRPAAQARLRTGHRRRRRAGAGHRRQGARGARPAGLDHRPQPPRRPDEHGHPRPHPLPLDGAVRREARPRRRGGGRAARAVQPPGADPAPRARPGRRRPREPVRRRPGEQPDVLRRRHPRGRGGVPDLGRRRREGGRARDVRARRSSRTSCAR